MSVEFPEFNRFSSEYVASHPPTGDDKAVDAPVLGRQVRGVIEAIQCIEASTDLTHVELEVEDVTALCPITNQPDFYTLRIWYMPNGKCIETKSLKLYLMGFRAQGIFAEALVVKIARHIAQHAQPRMVRVTADQSTRGGIIIRPTCELIAQLNTSDEVLDYVNASDVAMEPHTHE
jgi:7-cyano-7-deazaguanine reductase